MCIKYFSFGCDKIPAKKHVKKKEFIVSYSLRRNTVYNSWEIMWAVVEYD